MSMFRRRLLMMAAATPKSGLPAGWKETYYVQTKAGAEYFDSGIIPSRNTKVEMKIRFKDYAFAGGYTAFGNVESPNNFMFRTYANKFRGEYMSNVTELGQTINTLLTYTVMKDGPDNYIDGVKMPSNPDGNINPKLSLYLGACNNGNSPLWISGNYMYYCKIWENSEPVRDFIPVSDGTQEALYDLVTKTLFYKQSGPKTLDIGNEAEGGVE